jgi:hypothetical protein
MKNNSNNNLELAPDHFQARAIPFIYLDKNDKFVINEEAALLLDPSLQKKKHKLSGNGKNKIAVLCVAGAYRTGKSFLMN